MKMDVVAKLGDKINWFPGHMKRTLRLLDQNTSKVDIYLEIRDARLPYSSRNSQFDQILKKAQKKKLIIFNKYDLCDPKKTDKIIKDYNDYGIECVSVSTQKHQDMRKLIGCLKQQYKIKYDKVGLWLCACGMPNVGKSSIITQMRMVSDLANKSGSAKSQASVCTTKGIKGFKVLQNPLIYLMDSPGVMIPSNIPAQFGLKMALLGLIKQKIVDKFVLVQYMIEYFQFDKNDKYYKNLRVQKPKDANDFLQSVRKRYGLYDYDAALDKILLSLRQGKLGPITLDNPVQLQQ